MDEVLINQLLSVEDESLWEHQKWAKRQIYESWKDCRSIMLQMPTGTGKTRLFVSIIVDFLNIGLRRILVLAHRTELINQIQRELERQCKVYYNRDLKSVTEDDLEKKGEELVKSIESVTIMSPQMANNRLYYLNNMDLVIVDEAHHSTAETYRNVLGGNCDAMVLGVTATPVRENGKGFTDLYNKLIKSNPVRVFIKNKILSNYKYYSIKPQSFISKEIEKIEYVAYGDYTDFSMNKYFNTDRIRTNVLNMYKQYANGKKGIIYTINRTHNIDLANRFIQDGIKARYIDSDTPYDVRERTVREFRLGLFDVLLNVKIFTEGFDCPDVEFIMLARPTLSLGLYLQQVGRGMRYVEGNEPLIILDAVGLYQKFGLPDIPRNWQVFFNGAESLKIERKSFVKFITGTDIDLNKRISEGDDPVELIDHVDYDDETEPVNHSNWQQIEVLYNRLLAIAEQTSKAYINELSVKDVVSYEPVLGYNIFNPCESIKCEYNIDRISYIMLHRRKPVIIGNDIQYPKFESQSEFLRYEMKMIRLCFYDAYREEAKEVIDQLNNYDIFNLITYVGHRYGKESKLYSAITDVALNEDFEKLSIVNLFENVKLRTLVETIQ